MKKGNGPIPHRDGVPLRLLFVDDHPVVRHGLRSVFGQLEDFEVVGEAADGAEALAVLGTLEVDVVLMDLQMGAGMDGVTATRRIAQLPDPPPVLILTIYDSDADILAAVEAGVLGYMLKDAPPDQLATAVRAAAAGETALAPAVAAKLRTRRQAPSISLTSREIEIIELLATGLPNRAIARTLFISEATVKSHLVHIFDKFSVDNRTAAISVALDRKVIRSR